MGKPIFIAGATATGKSAVAQEVAKKIGGEIISVDSMQVYRKMDIGTAKPTAEQREQTPHHIIDCTTISEGFDAARFVREAENKKTKIEHQIFCGGTGLYFQAWLEGLGEAPSGDSKIRKVLEETPTQDLLRELKEKDPSTHKSIDHQNPRRIIRAIEVIRITDRPFSEQKAKWTNQAPANFFLLERADQDLRKRIESRAEKMFERGLVEETCSLRTELENNPSAQQALGYRQVIGHLRGEQSLPETINLVKSRTWQYAKRQKTWFRKIRGAIEVKAAEAELEKETAQRIIDLIE